MSLFGVGLDIVELDRVEALLAGPAGGRFVAKVLTEREQEVLASMPSKRRVQYVAGRFAMKEAVAKALGCGIGALAGFQDIEAMPDEYGKPVCRLSEAALARLGLAGRPPVIHVAITHERSMAASTAVIVQVS